MKTRIIHTKIHFEDDWFNTLSIGYRYLFIYLFTNSHIGLTGTYKLTKRVAVLETGATDQEWTEACTLFEKANKIKTSGEWITIVNAQKYANYSGPKNAEAIKRELAELPDEARDTLSIQYDTPLNHKSETINHNSYIKDNKSESIGDGYEKFLKAKEELGKLKKV